jgi:hypothetical protein
MLDDNGQFSKKEKRPKINVSSAQRINVNILLCSFQPFVYLRPHFADEDTEAQEGWVAPRSLCAPKITVTVPCHP